MTKLCVNMIVRNEADKIERCLASVAPYVNYYAILDTGSTDGTIKKIQDFMAIKGINGVIGRTAFKNFEQARNAALELARQHEGNWDYLLLCDADMELAVTDPDFKKQLTGLSHNAVQRSSNLTYENTRFLSKKATGKYVGVTHEYLDVPSAGCIQGVAFADHADGSNRANKFQRDIRLLRRGLRDDPKNGRYWFYLAQSYKDNGDFEQARKAYMRRIALGGWDEEIWYSRLQLARCDLALGEDNKFVAGAIAAYNMRPSRAEPLYDLSNHYRGKGMHHASLMAVEEALRIPYPKDMLFVSNYVYEAGLKEELSISAYYDPKRRDQGFGAANALALNPHVPEHTRTLARSNLFHYVQPLEGNVDSFRAQRIPFNASPDYTCMNPSIASLYGRMHCIVRTVNYTMDENGGYLIKGNNGEANATNPINTVNYLVSLTDDFEVCDSYEIRPPEGFPAPVFNLVLGFEDMRLFGWRGDLWASTNVRDQNPEGWCEQAMMRLPHMQPADNYKRMFPPYRQHEKNWAPWVANESELRFMYRVGTTITPDGKMKSDPLPVAVDNISGGTQVIPWREGYLTVTHEAYQRPDSGKRWYLHRFLFLDPSCSILKFSRPFVFHDKVIEFAAGLCKHPDGKRIVISYGREDAAAWVCTLQDADVASMVWG